MWDIKLTEHRTDEATNQRAQAPLQRRLSWFATGRKSELRPDRHR
jgi:hypothetical protein